MKNGKLLFQIITLISVAILLTSYKCYSSEPLTVNGKPLSSIFYPSVAKAIEDYSENDLMQFKNKKNIYGIYAGDYEGIKTYNVMTLKQLFGYNSKLVTGYVQLDNGDIVLIYIPGKIPYVLSQIMIDSSYLIRRNPKNFPTENDWVYIRIPNELTTRKSFRILDKGVIVPTIYW